MHNKHAKDRINRHKHNTLSYLQTNCMTGLVLCVHVTKVINKVTVQDKNARFHYVKKVCMQ